jgi:hypothetical protein
MNSITRLDCRIKMRDLPKNQQHMVWKTSKAIEFLFGPIAGVFSVTRLTLRK